MRDPFRDWVPPAPKGDPKLTPIFGCQPFTPSTTCDDIHPGGPIPASSRCVCMANQCMCSSLERRMANEHSAGLAEMARQKGAGADEITRRASKQRRRASKAAA